MYRIMNPGWADEAHRGRALRRATAAGIAESSSGAQFVVARYTPPGNVLNKFGENVFRKVVWIRVGDFGGYLVLAENLYFSR